MKALFLQIQATSVALQPVWPTAERAGWSYERQSLFVLLGCGELSYCARW